MIPRSSIAGMACLAFLSSFEQLLCFAAAAPAPRMEVDRPKFYFPKHVKRIVTNGTKTQTSSSDTETEKSTLATESSTQTPTNTLNQISSQSLTLSLESLLSSLIPAAIAEGVPFTSTTPIQSASPSSTDISGGSARSSTLDAVSLSITLPAITASVTTLSSTQPLSSVVASSNDPSQSASTLSKSSGSIDLPDIVVPLGTGATPKQNTSPSLASGFGSSLTQTASDRSSSQIPAELVSTSRVSESSETSFSSAATSGNDVDTESSTIKPLEKEPSKPRPTASKSVTPEALSSSATDFTTNGTKPDDSTFQSVSTTTKPTLETGATEFIASVTTPPTTVPVGSGTPSSGQIKSGDLAITRSSPAGQLNSASIEYSSNSTASLTAELVGDITDGLSELVKSSGSAFADSTTQFTIESTNVRSQSKTLENPSIQTTPLSNSSTTSVIEEDIIAPKAGILKSASEISFALFGANTIVFSTSKPAPTTSGISSQVSLTESATQGRDTVATNSSGADITTSNESPRKTNTPEPIDFVPSGFGVSNIIGVRTTTPLSSTTPVETNTIKPSSVEPELFVSTSSGVNVSSTATSAGKTNIAQRPDFELPDLDDLISLRQTASTGVPASKKTETAQRSSFELPTAGPISIGASTSIETGVVGEKNTLRGSSGVVSESDGSFTPGVTAPTTASVPATTNTAREGNDVQSEDGASGPTGKGASLPVKTPESSNASTASATVTAKATITASGGGFFPIPVIIPLKSETATLLNSILPKPDSSGSNLLEFDSSTPAVPEKSITVGRTGSVVAESNILASSISKISVEIPLTISGASDAPQPTLSDRLGTTQPVAGATEPTGVTREATPKESNKPGTELLDGATGGPSKSLALPPSSQVDDSLPQFSGLPRLGPSASDISGTTGLGLSKTSNIEAPEATESSASQSGGPRLTVSESVITSGKEPATEAPNEPSATKLPEIKTLSTDAPSEQTGSIPGKPVSAEPSASQSDGPRLTVSESVTISGKEPATEAPNEPSVTNLPEIKTLSSDAVSEPTGSIPGKPVPAEPSASQSDGPRLTVSESVITSGKEPATEAPKEPSATKLPEIKTLSTDAPSEQTGSIPGKPVPTADRDGSPIVSSSFIDIPVPVKPSSAAQTDAFTEKPSLASEGPPIVVSSITGLSSQTSLPAVTALPPLVEPSRASGISSSAGETPQTSDGSPILVPGATDSLPSIGPSRTTQTDAVPTKVNQPEPSRAAQTDAATEGASTTDLLPVIEPSRTATADLVSEKPASTSDLRGSLAISTPSVTDSQPPIEPSPATQKYSASISETLGEGRPSNALPIPISASSSAASVAGDLPPAVISPTLSRPPALPSLSVPTSIANDPDASTPVPPAVTPGPETSGGVPVEPSKPVSASDDQFTSEKLIVTPSAGSETGLPVVVPQTSRTADQVPIISNPLTNSDLKTPLTSDIPIVPITVNPPVSSTAEVASTANIVESVPITVSPAVPRLTSDKPIVPLTINPAVSSTAEVASPPTSDIFQSVPVTVSPAVPLTTEAITKSGTNLPPVILPQPSETSIISPPIPIDQSTFTASATSKAPEVSASTGGLPPVIILPSSGPGSQTTESAVSAPTGSQLLATATPGDAPVTASGSSAPILVGISDILTATSSNPAVSGYASPSQPGSTPPVQRTGINVEPSGLSPSAGAIPTGTQAGSVSATNLESVPPNPGVTTGYSSAPLKAEGSGVSSSQAASVTSAIETSKGYPPSGAGLAASPVETSKTLSGLEATASLGGANPAQATTQSSGASGGSTTVGTQIDLAPSTGVAEVASSAASQTDATGARPSSAVVGGLSSSVPNDVGSVKPESTAIALPPSAAASAPSTITPPVKENPNAEYTPKGTNVATPTGTDTLTAQLIGSSIIAEPSASMPTASADFPTGIPSSVPRIISPPDGVPQAPANTTLCQIGFLYPLHYNFVLKEPQSQRQIFKYLPQGVADGLTIPLLNVTMQTLRAYDTIADLGYITTLALFFIPSQYMDLLQLDLHTPTHHIYNNTDPSVKTMMSMINPAIPLIGDSTLGTPSAPGNGNDDSFTSSDSDPVNEGVPIGGVDNSSPVRGKSVGIAAGVLCGAAAYGAAMFFVARRYRKRKQSHGRSPSMMSSPVLSGVSHDYMGGANTALMSGGRGDGDRSLTPHNGYHYERQSRGSGHSGSTGRHIISAPTNAENSLGWN